LHVFEHFLFDISLDYWDLVNKKCYIVCLSYNNILNDEFEKFIYLFVCHLMDGTEILMFKYSNYCSTLWIGIIGSTTLIIIPHFEQARITMSLNSKETKTKNIAVVD